MGPEVSRVSGGARVDAGFGPWIKQQRELRSIPLGYVAARTRIPSDRLLRIESGLDLLGRDGQGRSTARLLALTIGADPEEASCLLEEPLGARRRGALLAQLPWLRWGMLGAGASLCLLLMWVLANQLLSSEAPLEASPEVIYRPDYVERLLSDEADKPKPDRSIEVDAVDVGAGPAREAPQ